jgi:L-rhamnose isomerase/sugar isomerase
MQSAIEIARAHAQAQLVDAAALAAAQEANDALTAHRLLKSGFLTDVSPLIAEARLRAGGALDPIATYRASGYRAAVARERPAVAAGSAGIV